MTVEADYLAPLPSAAVDTAEGASETSPRYRFSRRIVCLSEPESPAARSIGDLRTHLLAGHFRAGRRAMAVCGTSEDVGASFVAINLAVAIARAGISTVLVDADMHAPSLEDYIQPDLPANGLRQMLAPDLSSRTDEIRRDVLPNLAVLYAGGADRNASELLAGREFKAVMDDCMRDFEFTIAIAPAYGDTADARRVATSMRYALLTARRDRSYLSEVKKLAADLSNDRVRLVGTFMTDF